MIGKNIMQVSWTSKNNKKKKKKKRRKRKKRKKKNNQLNKYSNMVTGPENWQCNNCIIGMQGLRSERRNMVMKLKNGERYTPRNCNEYTKNRESTCQGNVNKRENSFTGYCRRNTILSHSFASVRRHRRTIYERS